MTSDVGSTAGGLVVASGRDRTRGLFYVFVSVGMVASLVLGIRQVLIEPVIQLDEVRGSEESMRPVQAQVLARNTSRDTTYCVEITITAADTEGLSLRTAEAEPTTGDGVLGPGRSANFVVVFDDLTEQQIEEELSDFFAFVTRDVPCP